MIPPSGAAGFYGHGAPVTSTRLIDAVAASLAFAALSICAVVTCTLVLSIKAGVVRNATPGLKPSRWCLNAASMSPLLARSMIASTTEPKRVSGS